ncbi:PP2C family protein-serine/threonine phosphatase [Streptomyces sp. UNOB3_S3]|uniref:PP2C family protein-serine/threonine phosphatase n=1 Tax=Streptomyces sp. UNOB3_S3 TaxID=2871682 RepID=UPI001E2CC89F|nr:PP2C family protein-serine/threonine phosphatase [Streptomyces sp. UNOB3_S3]MCC3778451.1 serine/threonine-protein phosphatase [Streptomyces sp. UNOB3_S3]
MHLRRPPGTPRSPGRPSRTLVAVPLLVIVAVTVVDVLAPPEVHLGPFLVAAPAITASFAGPRLTGAIGVIAVLAQSVVAVIRTSLTDLNHTLQISALILISAIVTLFAHRRERHEKEMTQLRSVAEATQGVVMRPLPRRVGPLRIGSVYLAAEAEARIGGDLYAVARTARGTRLVIGDVRGKGLEAIGDAALVLGAFRAAAHRQAELPVLVADLEGALSSGLSDPGVAREERPHREEAFVTAAVLDVPDADPVLRMVSCGHPPPLLLRDSRVIALEVEQPGLPLGLIEFSRTGFAVESFAFGPGDLVLLYTDGVVEARDATGRFYPLAERLASWPGGKPEALLRYLCEDLLAHSGGSLGDDAALVAVQRLTTDGTAAAGSPAA